MGALRYLLLLTLILGPDQAGRTVRDFDAPFLAASKAKLLDRTAPPAARIRAMQDVITRNATAAREILAGAIDDPDFTVRRSAAEWLSALRDPRGLSWEAACLDAAECTDYRYQAARILGNSKDARYAPMIRRHVQRILQSGIRGGVWDGSAADRAMLKYGAIALARIGVPDDRELVLAVVRARPSGDPAFLEALGYVNDPQSREILWSAERALTRTPTCSKAGLAVPALLALSRLGEERAIQAVKDILHGRGTPSDPWPEHGFPSLCADRAEAFAGVRPRDAKNFAATMLEIAGQQPEGPGTFAAWNALGLMRPEGFGERVLKLAVSRPRWRLVSHYMLNTVVLAVDPNLHDEFWRAYDDVKEVPAQTGMRTLVKEDLGHLLFSGSAKWTGD